VQRSTTARALKRDARQLSDLVHLIYEASVHPERWNGVVAQIAASFGSTKGLLFTPWLAPQQGGILFPSGIAESDLQIWGSSYIEHDAWARSPRARSLFRQGKAILDRQLVPHREFRATRFYRDFLSRMGIGRVCLGVVFEGAAGLPGTSLSVFRDAHDPAFNRSDQSWMELLVPHVSRSLGIMQRLDTAKLQNASLLASFDRLKLGVALLDEDMAVLHLNRAAKAVVDRGDGIFVDEQRRLGSGAGGSQGLSRWLEGVKDAPPERQSHFLDGRRVARDEQGRSYMVQCVAIPPDSAWTARSEPVAHVVFITDPATIELPNPSRLVELYALTEAQAKVVLQIANGGSYKQVARRLKISEETVRSHVKAIYPKVRVNRQADLVRLILSLSQSGV